MTTTLTRDGIYQEPDDSRDALAYRQADGYEQVTITIDVAYSQQHHTCSLPVLEDEEHLQRTDLYEFSFIDGIRAQLAIDISVGREEVWHTVSCDHFIADEQPISMSIVRLSESIILEPAICSQEALDEALLRKTTCQYMKRAISVDERKPECRKR
jgi:hypothetical protein